MLSLMDKMRPSRPDRSLSQRTGQGWPFCGGRLLFLGSPRARVQLGQNNQGFIHGCRVHVHTPKIKQQMCAVIDRAARKALLLQEPERSQL